MPHISPPPRSLLRELADYVKVSTPRHRLNALLFAQIPFALATIALAVAVGTDEKEIFHDPQFVAGTVLALVATAAAVVLQWQRIPAAWLTVIPLTDVVAVILIRAAAAHLHEDVGLFVIAPILWLALLTPWPVMVIGFVGLELTSLYPLLFADTKPAALYDWAELVLKPGLVMLLAVAVRVGMSRLRQRQRLTDELAHQLQSSLAASEHRESTINSVLNSVTAAIVLFDATGKVTLANNVARDMCELVGLPLDDGPVNVGALQLYRPDRTTPVELPAITTLYEFAEHVRTDIVYWIGARGNQRAVVATVSPVGARGPDAGAAGGSSAAAGSGAAQGGAPTGGTVAVVYDVTNLIEAVRVRDEFVSTTSHELRTPLTSILGYLDLIDAPALGIEVEIEVIERNAVRLLGMISDLLDVKVQTPVQRRQVDLTLVAGSAIAKRTSTAEAAGISLSSIAPAGTTPVLAIVDAVAIGRVIDNLLSNAIKFSHPGDVVTISTEVDDAVAVIAVTDTGVGISTEDQAHIFDQFFRAPSAKVAQIPGTGLGLAVVHSILEAHGASIAVESVLGEGTTVTVSIPRWPNQLEG